MINSDENIYHVTWTTFNSRVSERMKLYNIYSDKEWIFFDMEQEFQISLILESIVKELNLKILAYNICKDHIHIVLFSNKSDLSLIISKLKWKATKLYKDKYDITDKINLWWQKFNYTIIENKHQLLNTIDYVKKNRIKHWLPTNDKLNTINFCINVTK